MHHVDVVYLGLFVVLYGLVSKRLDGTALTAPMLAVVYGILLGPFGLGLMELDVEGGAIRLLAEFTLALLLFHDAARIDLRLLKQNLGVPERLLGPGLAGTFALGFGLGLLLLGDSFLGGAAGLGAWQVALVAAMLAPTDAALGQAVVSQESVPQRIRQALNVESGLNDGLVVPVVAICLACAVGGAQEAGAGHWVVHAAKAAGYGVLVGVVGGAVLAAMLDRARAAGWAGEGAVHYAVAAVPVVVFFGAELIHGSGFLAAFVAGLAMGSTTRHLERGAYEFTEDAGELLGHLTWIVFGVVSGLGAAELEIAPTDGVWKLARLEILDEERL